MVRDEIEDPDEKPQERRNGKEPAASDNGLLGRPADQREKNGYTERQQEKRNHLYPLLDSRVSGHRRHGLPKVLPASDAQAIEAISSRMATTIVFFMVSLQRNLSTADAFGHERERSLPVLEFAENCIERVKGEPAEVLQVVPQPTFEHGTLPVRIPFRVTKVPAIHDNLVKMFATPLVWSTNHLLARQRENLAQNPHDTRTGMPQAKTPDTPAHKFAVGLRGMREQHEVVHIVPEPRPLVHAMVIQILQLHNQRKTDARRVEPLRCEHGTLGLGQQRRLEFGVPERNLGRPVMDLYLYAVLVAETDMVRNPVRALRF